MTRIKTDFCSASKNKPVKISLRKSLFNQDGLVKHQVKNLCKSV